MSDDGLENALARARASDPEAVRRAEEAERRRFSEQVRRALAGEPEPPPPDRPVFVPGPTTVQ